MEGYRQVVADISVNDGILGGGFLMSINKKYFGTFFDARTGREFLCDL